MTEQPKTYVYRDTEVKLTGRTADKELKSTRRTKEPSVVTLHEITPVDSMNGTWKKWVRMTELFEVK